jgi:putative PIN family toxin of toxin-antitoxin system
MRVVVDTNVLISGLLNPDGAPARVLDLVLRGNLTLLYDNRLLSECREVMHRDKFSFTTDMVEPLLEYIASEGEYVVPEAHPAIFRDEDDRGFYEVAKSGGAAFLITGNRTRYPADSIIKTPVEFLASYRRKRRRM